MKRSQSESFDITDVSVLKHRLASVEEMLKELVKADPNKTRTNQLENQQADRAAKENEAIQLGNKFIWSSGYKSLARKESRENSSTRDVYLLCI